MAGNNQLNMVRNQFQTRGYDVTEVEDDGKGRWTFTIANDCDKNPVGVEVAFIASAANPLGDRWVSSNIHWGTNRTTYTGTVELSAADLADIILATIAADNLA